jgi:2,3-bisphosphoglycerate-dependent phosphoglycerate mutase
VTGGTGGTGASQSGDARKPAYRLVLLRHGESEWNRKGLFTGWIDVGLSQHGREEATAAGELIAAAGLRPDAAFTSVLGRAIETAERALAAADRRWIPVRRSWRLNERHYGALQGKDKSEIRLEFGDEQFRLWRRSYDVPPPPLPADSELAAHRDPRYAHLAPDALPQTECLRDVLARVLPYWHDAIVPALRGGSVVLVSAHGNSLRALVKHLDSISDDAIPAVNLPTGIPLLYALDGDLRPQSPVDPRFGLSGAYLDPEAAAASIAEVARQGAASPA